ncbi:MAG: hypothetical protein AAGB29_00495 [Planctomycetota bacterium]
MNRFPHASAASAAPRRGAQAFAAIVTATFALLVIPAPASDGNASGRYRVTGQGTYIERGDPGGNDINGPSKFRGDGRLRGKAFAIEGVFRLAELNGLPLVCEAKVPKPPSKSPRAKQRGKLIATIDGAKLRDDKAKHAWKTNRRDQWTGQTRAKANGVAAGVRNDTLKIDLKSTSR